MGSWKKIDKVCWKCYAKLSLSDIMFLESWKITHEGVLLMNGISIEVWYHTKGIEVESKANLYFGGTKNIDGVVQFVKDCYKLKTWKFSNFVVSVNSITDKYDYVDYSRMTIEFDGAGNCRLDYDVLGDKECYAFQTVFASKSERKVVNACIDKLKADIAYLYENLENERNRNMYAWFVGQGNLPFFLLQIYIGQK
jgi:hypothetical protein